MVFFEVAYWKEPFLVELVWLINFFNQAQTWLKKKTMITSADILAGVIFCVIPGVERCRRQQIINKNKWWN